MTGLSVKTLSWALDEASGKATGAVWARDTWAADKYGRFCDKLLAALATKSKRLEALEAQAAADAKVVEAIRQLPLEHLFALVAAQDSRWDEAESALINAENVLAGLDAALAARKPSE